MIGLTGYKIEAVGELALRLTQNAARLNAPCYRPDAIYSADQAGWPGDWEGRTILALVSLWNALGTKPAYLDLIMEDFPNHLNESGYIGPEHGPDDIVDEQQLSGHNWLVRGLTEYYLRTGSREIRDIILKIVENLYLPLRGKYAGYPLGSERGEGERGGYAGKITGSAGIWKTSSDIGCAFMCLDALSQVYEVFRIDSVRVLLEEMIGVFEKVDFCGGNMQTHASLSAVRGILKFAEATGDQRYFDIGKRIFDIYLRSGMTENYANYNWFGRIDTWTEPCAIVDSEMVSLTLFRLTNDTKYLTLANRIRFNALGYAQRPNGGFGTDKCVGLPEDSAAFPDADPQPACNPFLSPSGDGISEAFWCCTMRGSEGLRSILQHSLLLEKGAAGEPDTLWLPFATDVNADCGSFTLSVRSGLPYDCRYTVIITAASLPVSLELMIYTPAGIDRRHAELKPDETACFEGSHALESHTERSSDGRSIKYFRGDLLLGKKQGADLLRSLTDMIDLTLDEAGSDRRRILFEPEEAVDL
ncbi:MAG: hypothetical protein J5950_02060 [Clostridia bacterium]|nr:hypothetical protein [Clostridia bacterium]